MTEEEAAQRPHGLTPVVWQLGHIAYEDAMLVNRVRGGEPDVPAEYAELFRGGSSDKGDFPPLAEVRAAFQRVQQEVLKLTELPYELGMKYGSSNSSLAEGLMFIHMHRGWHNGKIMTLRALVGKPIMY